jgi:hypothetical protein
MGKTYKHRNKGKFNNGLLDEIPSDLKNMWDRSNNDWGEFRKAKKDLKDKIAEKEMKEEVIIIEKGEHIDFDIPEQEEIINKYNSQMNTYTKKELIGAKFNGLTMGDLAEFVYKNPKIPRDAKVLVERIEDIYFEGIDISGMNSVKGILPKGSKSEGWKVLLIEYEDLEKQFFPAWGISKENDDSIVYIFNHY